MTTVTRHIPRPPEACWRRFVDVRQLPAWLPGLRRAVVVVEGDDGLPREVAYEFAPTRTYSLRYEYDATALRVSWSPRVGARDAVWGEATFQPDAAGCLMTYRLAPGDARTAAGEADAAEALCEAFAAWMTRGG
jgi:uncharacterized protein YndB with AHSA1/START domain